MEPTDIDNLIKNKLRRANDAHQHELEAAKPFVWSAVQRNLAKRRTINWYHLAAAILLLLISFTFIFVKKQKRHEQELVLLSNKIDQLQQNYQVKLEELNSKDTQVSLLASELKNVQTKLSDLNQEKPIIQKERIVYQRDTVYLNEVEYITTVSDPGLKKEENINMEEGSFEQLAKAENLENEIDEIIYPSPESQSKKRTSETLKVKFLRASRN